MLTGHSSRTMFFLLLILALGANYSFAQLPQIYTDVPTWAPYHSETYVFNLFGISYGCGSSQYCPTRVITRKEAAVFIIKSIDYARLGYIPTYGTCYYSAFTDVPLDGFCPFIMEMRNRGITSGCGDGSTYCPDLPLSHSHMAVFAVRARQYIDYGFVYFPSDHSTQPYYYDIGPSNSAFPYVQALTDRLGYEFATSDSCYQGYFCPDAGIGRGATAVYLVRNAVFPAPLRWLNRPGW